TSVAESPAWRVHGNSDRALRRRIGMRFDHALPKGLRDGMASSHFAEQFTASLEGAPQRFIRFRRIEKRLHDPAMILNGNSDDCSFLYRPVRSLLGGIDDEFADAAALDFGGTFHHCKSVGADTRFDARRAIRLAGHDKSFQVMYGIIPN